jgi:hypothetical protein
VRLAGIDRCAKDSHNVFPECLGRDVMNGGEQIVATRRQGCYLSLYVTSNLAAKTLYNGPGSFWENG